MPRPFRRLLLVALAAVFLPVIVFANNQVRVVRVSYVNGDVQMDRGTGNGFEAALLNMPVVAQAHIRTGDDGEAELEFENGSTIRLTPDSELVVTELENTDEGAHITRLSFNQGLAYIAWKRSEGGDFELDSNGRSITLRKSSHLRVQADDQALAIAVFNGDVQVSGGESGPVEVKNGETLSLDSNDASRYYLARNIDTGVFDEWDRDRDNARSAVSQRQSTQYVPGANYYGPDLDYYGNWINSSYGSVWQPYGVAQSWSPWADGSWAWYPNWGWQWVSAYPWGFVPFHYGSWVFVPGYGYCWRRPLHWRAWNNVSGVQGLFAGGHPTGLIPPNGHDTGTLAAAVPHPPMQAFDGSGASLINVGRGPKVEWRDPVLRSGKTERPIDPMAFRGGSHGFFAPPPSGNGMIPTINPTPVEVIRGGDRVVRMPGHDGEPARSSHVGAPGVQVMHPPAVGGATHVAPPAHVSGPAVAPPMRVAPSSAGPAMHSGPPPAMHGGEFHGPSGTGSHAAPSGAGAHMR